MTEKLKITIANYFQNNLRISSLDDFIVSFYKFSDLPEYTPNDFAVLGIKGTDVDSFEDPIVFSEIPIINYDCIIIIEWNDMRFYSNDSDENQIKQELDILYYQHILKGD